MNELSPEARRALAQAKSGQPRASHALRARVKENVLRAVAAAPGEEAPLEAGSHAKSIFAKLPAWTLPSLGAIAFIGGIATFAVQRESADMPRAPQPSAARREVPSVQPLTAAPQREVRVQAPSPSAAEAGPSHANDDGAAAHPREHGLPAAQPRNHEEPPALGQRASVPARRDNDLRAEMQLLARAEAALRTNEPSSALSILDAHARKFSRGQLQSEREGLRLIAQCTLGSDPQQVLTEYLRDHRDGVLQSRIRSSCAKYLP